MSVRTAVDTRSGKATYGFAGSEDTGLDLNSSGSVTVLHDGDEFLAPFVHKITVSGSTATSGVIASWSPTNDYLILGAYVRVTTDSNGACTLDIGPAANATTADDTLFDGLSVATTGTFNSADNQGSNGKLGQTVTASVTVAVASGNATGLVADVYLVVVPLS